MDALGQRISPGDIVATTESRLSGFNVEVVKRISANVVYLADRWSTGRKFKENLIVISEEQLIGYITKIFTNNQSVEGMVNEYDNNVGRYVDVPLADAIYMEVRKVLQTSRTIKNIPLGEYEPTELEKKALDEMLNRK